MREDLPRYRGERRGEEVTMTAMAFQGIYNFNSTPAVLIMRNSELFGCILSFAEFDLENENLSSSVKLTYNIVC